MFGSGFGAESEARDAQKHITGRRHGPRDMTNVAGVPNSAADKTMEAQRAFQTHRAAQQRHMETGPSFLDQMFDSRADRQQKANPTMFLKSCGALPGQDSRVDSGGMSSFSSPATVNGSGGGVGTRRSGPQGREPLNIFSWNDEYQQKGLREKLMMERDSEMRALCPPEVVGAKDLGSLRRDGDAKKFERSTDNHFLNFGEDKSTALPGRKPLGTANPAPPFAVNYEQREVKSDPSVHHPCRRRPGPAMGADAGAPSFEGFPGLGGANGGIASSYASPTTLSAPSSPYSSASKVPHPHVTVPRPISNVFLPELANSGEGSPLAPQSSTSTEIQRLHQLRTKAEVGIPCPSSTAIHRHLGPYSTSNASYGEEDGVRSPKRFAPSKPGNYPSEAMPYGSMAGGTGVSPTYMGQTASGIGRNFTSPYEAYGSHPSALDMPAAPTVTPSSLSYPSPSSHLHPSQRSYSPSSYITSPATAAAVTGGGNRCDSTYASSPSRQDLYSLGDVGYGSGNDMALNPSAMSPSGISTATSLTSNVQASEMGLAEYEQELRRRLQQRQLATAGDTGEEDMTSGSTGAAYAWSGQERMEPSVYDYSPERGLWKSNGNAQDLQGMDGAGALYASPPSGGYGGTTMGASSPSALEGSPATYIPGTNPCAASSSPLSEGERRVRFQT